MRAQTPPPSPGVVERAAACPGIGWLLVGHAPQPWADAAPAGLLQATLTLGSVTGPATTCFVRRDGTAGEGWAFVSVLAAPCPPGARLTGLEVPTLGLRMPAPVGREPDNPDELATDCRRLLRTAPGGAEADHPVLALLPRRPFDGTDSVAALWPPVHFELDAAIRVPPDCLALTGWFVDAGNSVQALRVCGDGGQGNGTAARLDPDGWVAMRRTDVMEKFGPRYGLDSDSIGFLAYAPGVSPPGGRTWLEVETRDGAIAHKPIQPIDRTTLGVIKQFLSVPRPPQAAIGSAFDAVIGPVIAGLNRARLARPRRFSDLAYGSQPPTPERTLVVTLHGRLDFMEYQLALFSEQPDPGAEIIYVLDDPRLREDAERLAGSCWARFRLPFRLLALAENLGFAPANNVGLRAGRGRHACLLNSDVFPAAAQGMAWLPALAAELDADPAIGAIAPLLVYEDGTLQHGGMHYEHMPGLPPWPFPVHTGKGRPAPGQVPPLRSVPAITGACVVLRRDDVLAGGGLDERYLIGDFEDSDLCQRLQATGKRCAVDARWRLCHLERQSQGEAQPWRGNATLFNAWQHQQQWGHRALVP